MIRKGNVLTFEHVAHYGLTDKGVLAQRDSRALIIVEFDGEPELWVVTTEEEAIAALKAKIPTLIAQLEALR